MTVRLNSTWCDNDDNQSATTVLSLVATFARLKLCFSIDHSIFRKLSEFPLEDGNTDGSRNEIIAWRWARHGLRM
jgi:hypothetical protein